MSERQVPLGDQQLIELGKIFLEFWRNIKEEERDYVSVIGDKGSVSPRDVRNSVIKTLWVISNTYELAERYLGEEHKFRGFYLPWPLLLLREELEGINEGWGSYILTTDNASKPPSGAQSRIRRHGKALGAAVFDSLTQDFLWETDCAANMVSKAYQHAKIKTGGATGGKDRSREVTAKTVIEWSNDFSRSRSDIRRALSPERKYLAEQYDKCRNLCRQVREKKEITDGQKAAPLLVYLNEYLRCTSVRRPEKSPEE